ncbi:hypothetical protein ymoll0001_31480 [Yersinia mollaretii ATCC 43969]|uniref:Uncharacterized protein n=1 Tax=Yersinia mollaretii (strain ATCC 43969 / DSM 18520 / CIP 103324 / CNY 7263 / WAIP 204) TaxID=349967 RepID=A0ABP2E9Y0_YERMW|nr:hypothetical protein ymoll0001_31480 [Yersinia mollaretii ATCC 43969]
MGYVVQEAQFLEVLSGLVLMGHRDPIKESILLRNLEHLFMPWRMGV